jgi:hypothetical protein
MSTILHHGSILHSISLLVMLSKSWPWLDIRAIVEGMMHRICAESCVVVVIMRKKWLANKNWHLYILHILITDYGYVKWWKDVSCTFTLTSSNQTSKQDFLTCIPWENTMVWSSQTFALNMGSFCRMFWQTQKVILQNYDIVYVNDFYL